MTDRPAAFLLVKVIAPLPVTPNQVTMLSLAAGLAAAYAFSSGTPAGFTWGALFYLFANILDCADGQLARLQKSGTVLGRVVDGAADYCSGIAIFIGLGIGLASSGAGTWWLVVFAGISSGVHAMFFDRYQTEFISSAAGETDFIGGEIARFEAEIARLPSVGTGAARICLLQCYMAYMRVQKRFRPAKSPPAPGVLPANRVLMIRIWSLLGPTTNRTLLIVCALVGRIDVYLWSVAVAGNAWLLAASLLQARLRRATGSAPAPAAARETR